MPAQPARFALALFGVTALACLLASRTATAATINVPGNAATIQAGVDLANGGDHVVIANGTWTGIGNRDVVVAKGVTIRSASGNPALCIVDCQLAGRGFRFEGFSSAAKLESITITNGSASSGGGILFTAGVSPQIKNCRILGNRAITTGGGGVAVETGCSPKLIGCTISGNICSGSNGGAGVWNVGGSPSLINCILSGNRTSGIGLVGGAVYTTSNGAFSLTNTVLFGNSAYDGSGIYCSFSSNPTLVNCIVWGNLPGQSGIPIVQAFSAVAQVTYTDIQGGFAGTGNLMTSPVFMDANGADDSTGTGDDDFRLGRFSPCTDAGNDSAPGLVGVTVDQGGQPRFFDDIGVIDTGNGAAPVVDIGPFERQSESIPMVFHVPADVATLSAAVGLAGPGDEILIADGTHTGAGNRNIVIDKEIEIRSASGNPSACILDAQSAARVISFVGVGNGARLEAITITHGSSTQGAGVYCSPASPTLFRCRIVANTASVDGGGGMYCTNASAPQLTNCEIRNNVASGTYGGGMYNKSGSNPVLTNCVLSGNSTTGLGSTGGAIYNWTSSPVLINCSIGGNTAYDASVLYNQVNSLPQLRNCIVWGNAQGQSGPITNLSGSSTTIVYSDMQGGAAGTGNIQVDPQFLDTNLMISDTSPCVDVGSNAYVVESTDMSGGPRIADGDGNGSAIVDMGAYEIPSSATGTPEVAGVGASGIALIPPRPNPFKSETQVAFRIDTTQHVSMCVYDAAGRKVRSLFEGARGPGMHSVDWDGRSDDGRPVSTGVYLLRLSAGRTQLCTKIHFVR
jgi:parallel beta-helix repeat protein